MKLYELYFIKTNVDDKVLEVLKYQYIILSNIKDDEYNKIYNNYFKQLNKAEDSFAYRRIMSFPKNKNKYINLLLFLLIKINFIKSKTIYLIIEPKHSFLIINERKKYKI